jgi:hypothetical protein
MKITFPKLLAATLALLVAATVFAGPPKVQRPRFTSPATQYRPVKIASRVSSNGVVLSRFNAGGMNLTGIKLPSANKTSDFKRPAFTTVTNRGLGHSISSASRTFKASQPKGPARMTATPTFTRVIRK